MHTSNEIAIRVIHKQRGTDSVWSLNTLAEKVLTMRDMYQRLEEGGTGPLLVCDVRYNEMGVVLVVGTCSHSVHDGNDSGRWCSGCGYLLHVHVLP